MKDPAHNEYRLRTLSGIRCKTHRRYEAKRKPRGNCEDCWRLWIKVHP